MGGQQAPDPILYFFKKNLFFFDTLLRSLTPQRDLVNIPAWYMSRIVIGLLASKAPFYTKYITLPRLISTGNSRISFGRPTLGRRFDIGV